MMSIVNQLYDWFKGRNWENRFTKLYENGWRDLFRAIGYEEDFRSAKKLTQRVLVIYGILELLFNAQLYKLFPQPYLILYPSCIFIFGSIGFYHEESYLKFTALVKSCIAYILYLSPYLIIVFLLPHLSVRESLPQDFELATWDKVFKWVGICISSFSIIILGLWALAYGYFQFSNFLTSASQKYARYCLKRNEKMPFSILVSDLSILLLAIPFLVIVLSKLLDLAF